ncbi:metallophosphoesterase [Candidatus Daviesbacteria bacterium]|nr:metallophosphoesterase [Candidatus Daviesbacteria bacterium]
MFSILGFGLYSAYVQFSGTDPLKIDPKALILSAVSSDETVQIVDKVFGFKLPDNIAGKNMPIIPNSAIDQSANQKTQAKNTLFSFMLIADSHNENSYLEKALSQAKTGKSNLAFVIGLGDYTQVGTIEELQAAKKELDKNSLRYFVVPGDHDHWDARNKQLESTTNFKQVFGVNYQSFIFQGIKFILIDNSDNYKGVDTEQLKWLENELENTKTNQKDLKSILVFVHTPLSHPSSDHVMGRVEKELRHQARNLSILFKEYGVRKVFAGDVHFFTDYTDSETGLDMMTIGAAASQRNTQAPRFAIVNVYDDGNISVEDMEIR